MAPGLMSGLAGTFSINSSRYTELKLVPLGSTPTREKTASSPESRMACSNRMILDMLWRENRPW